MKLLADLHARVPIELRVWTYINAVFPLVVYLAL